MWACRATGVAGAPDDLTLLYTVADLDVHIEQMRLLCYNTVVALDYHLVAVPALVALVRAVVHVDDMDYPARHRREQVRADRRGNIHARMTGAGVLSTRRGEAGARPYP